ncbi:MAG: alginate biosynthesis protein [Phyllobacterium sp.]|uniref:alginate O-acetyltransferase AlgX-related protein n=1 Tax=Phyllobacterium sp. TaxID=1871046 RepID=UPI0030F16688
MLKCMSILAGLLLVTCATIVPAASSSAYGCANLESNQALPTLEGKEGYFYRVMADLRMQHPLSNHIAELIGALDEALAATGTTLVYVPIPTKSLVMPQYLPEAAHEYGFDYDVAEFAYKDVVEKLNARGVITVDVLNAMRHLPQGKAAFLQADFHWTSAGAEAAAKVVAETMSKLPGFARATSNTFETRPLGEMQIISTMRRILQENCTKALPPAVTEGYGTTETAPAAAVDIFGDAQPEQSIVLVGTSYSDLAAANFDGFLSQSLAMPVTNFAISGGDQFGSITSYMTSEAFLNHRPKVLVWENPIYNNLGKFGDTPLIELMAAARQACRTVDRTQISPAGDNALSVSVSAGQVPDHAVIYAYSGNDQSRHAALKFRLNDGHLFESGIWRADRVVSSGRYYFPVRYFGSRAAHTFQLAFDQMSLQSATVSICSLTEGQTK